MPSAKVDILFCELLQVAIGTREILSAVPTETEWRGIYQEAKRQSLLGICFDGIEKYLSNVFDPERSAPMNREWVERLNLPRKGYLLWAGNAAQIQEYNEKILERAAELSHMAGVDGLKCVVFKGPAVASLYGELSTYRQPGDIDAWIPGTPSDLIMWAKNHFSITYLDYHHLDFKISDTDVELHYRPSISRNLVRNHRLQKLSAQSVRRIEFVGELGFSCFPADVNIPLLLNHILWHFLYEGVGMRQLMDLFFALRAIPEEDQEIRKRIRHNLRRLDLEKFTSAVMWVLKNVFDPDGDSSDWMILSPDEEEGRFLLNEIRLSGNMGQHDDRLKNKAGHGRLSLFRKWTGHSFRLLGHYTAEVLWNPVGIVFISIVGRLMRNKWKLN